MPEMKSLDLRYMVRELSQALTGGRIQKIYQYAGDELLLEVHAPGKGTFWLSVGPDAVFLSTHRRPSPDTPPGFCMLLRKRLAGSRIEEVRQHAFDRVVEILAGGCVLVCEMVPPGNVILCDSFYTIIMPMRTRRYKDRQLVPRARYAFPPGREDPYSVSDKAFSGLLKASDEPASAFLARLGFGSAYAMEACDIAGVDPLAKSSALTAEQASMVRSAVRRLGDAEPSPVSYEDGSAFPFPLRSRKDRIVSSWGTLSAALDAAHCRMAESQLAGEASKGTREKREKMERITAMQEKAAAAHSEKAAASKEAADAIYSSYGFAAGLLRGIREARERGMDWAGIRERLLSARNPGGDAVIEVREKEGIVIAALSGIRVALDMRKSAEENAASYYEGSKRSRRKGENAEAALKAKLGELKEALEVAGPAPKAVIRKGAARQKAWYEAYRWFRSSEGFLIVAGKDAETNEALVKRHAREGDAVFHSDIRGSAFVVLVSRPPAGGGFAAPDAGGFTPLAKREAAGISAAYSKAWSTGLGGVDVFSASPAQLSKSPPSGTSLPKGSFMVYGEREWFRAVPVEMHIGLVVDRAGASCSAVSGPERYVKSKTRYAVRVMPGSKPAGELAKEIISALLPSAAAEDRKLIAAARAEDIERLVPTGRGELGP